MKKKNTKKSRIEELRKKNHQSQRMLADSLGTSQQTISRIEGNIYRTPVDLLIRLSYHFNVTVDYLLELTDISSAAKPDNNISNKFKDYYEFLREYDSLSEVNRVAVRQLTRALLNSGSAQ